MSKTFILGASGAGTSTLGAAVASALAMPHFDVDNFYWLPTDPPFTKPRPRDERLSRLVAALDAQESWVLEGSMSNWGDPLVPRFDLVVFLTVDPAIRMERLRQRERRRYGHRIEAGGDMVEQSAAFLAWAAAYDTAGQEQRSRAAHETWLGGLAIPVLRLNGAEPVIALRDAVLSTLRSHSAMV